MKNFLVKVGVGLCILGCHLAQSEESAPEQNTSHWQHESEIAAVTVGGNVESESISLKQQTQYSADSRNLYLSKARYLSAQNKGTQTALAWEANLRYKRVISEDVSAFIQQGAESDRFSGFEQRNITDLGARVEVSKTKAYLTLAEVGLRHRRDQNVGQSRPLESQNGRLYLEHSHRLSPTVSTKLWLEYSPNFTDSNAWLLNAEPSLTVVMSDIVSIRVSYLTKYQNKPALITAQKRDTALTTSLVAQF